MGSFQYDPLIAKMEAGMQTVRLLDGKQVIGVAHWFADDGDGVVQILDFRVEAAYARQGHGKRLLAAVVEQCQQYLRGRERTLRRMWMILHHKRHAIARAFFLSQGFTHITSIREVAGDQGMLVYVRAFD